MSVNGGDVTIQQHGEDNLQQQITLLQQQLATLQQPPSFSGTSPPPEMPMTLSPSRM